MELDTANSIALTALIVSLIALLVALFQFLQSSAITAEGWRQCGPASLGGWSIFRAWVWHWTEWRYEVFFTTPEVVILNGSMISFNSKEDIVRGVRKAADEEEAVSNKYDVDEDSVIPVFDSTCKIDYDEEGDLSREAYHVLGFNTLPAQIQEQWTAKSRMAPSRKSSLIAKMPKWLRGRRLFRDTDFSSGTELTSWGRLVDKLFQYQLDGLRANQSHKSEPQIVRDQTFVAIKLRQESWDFLPTDVARPPARIRLGDLLLLANRIGMTWKKVNTAQQEYFAERNFGQQCVLYSSNIRSLGTVFCFEALSKRTHFRPRQMLCSSNADKMYFGIIPGCKKIGIEDIHTIGRKREADVDELSKHLRFSRSVNNARIEAQFWANTINNDLLALIAPFMPLEGCPIVRIMNPVPNDAGPNGRHVSFFGVWQVRAALYAKLDNSPDFAGKSDLLELFAALRKGDFRNLRASKMDEVWCNRDSIYEAYSNRDMHDPGISGMRQDILDVISVLRAVHDVTSDWFTKCQAEIDKRRGEKGSEESFYLELLRAHFDMAARSMLDFVKMGRPDPAIELETLRNYGRPHAGHKARSTAMCETWPAQLNPRSGQGIVGKIRREYSESDISNDKVQQAWWYLIIRGIAWNMSVDIEMPEYSGSKSTLLPSDLYQDRSLVWLL